MQEANQLDLIKKNEEEMLAHEKSAKSENC